MRVKGISSLSFLDESRFFKLSFIYKTEGSIKVLT